MKCPKCKGELPDGSAECHHCGIFIQKFLDMQAKERQKRDEDKALRENKRRTETEKAEQRRLEILLKKREERDAIQEEREAIQEERNTQRKEYQQKTWTRCYLCDAQVSKHAASCPKCGNPINPLRSVFEFHWVWVFMIAVGVVGGGVLAAILTLALSIFGIAGIFSMR